MTKASRPAVFRRGRDGSRAPDPALAPTPERPRVLYIMGAGRSGSTVLDTILGNHPLIESVGELNKLIPSGWLNDEYCACGARGRSCPFWSRVRDAWAGAAPSATPERYLALARRFESWPGLARALLGRSARSTELAEYREHTLALLDAVETVSGKPVLVDSSKSPSRALALAALAGVDLHLIHLVRDGRGVANSYLTAHAKDEKAGLQRALPSVPAARTARSWILVNLAAEVTRLFVPRHRSIRVRYEDLVADPSATIRRIGRVIGLDVDDVLRRLDRRDTFDVGHTIAGNRVRMKGRIRLQADLRWHTSLSRADQARFYALTAPLMLRFGYRLRPGARARSAARGTPLATESASPAPRYGEPPGPDPTPSSGSQR